MSLNLHVSALDLDAFRAVQGSRDERLLARILENVGDRLKSMDEYLGRLDREGIYAPLADVIARIVRGEVSETDPALFEYEVAAAVIADALGQRLDAEALSEARPEFWQEIDATIQAAVRAASGPVGSWPTLAALLDRGPLLEVPLDAQLRLGTGYLTAEEARRALAVAELADVIAASAAAEVEWPDEVGEAVEEYRCWLGAAARANVGLFLHR